MKKTTIRLSYRTKSLLDDLGNKNESYEGIILKLIHERNILFIHELCKNNEINDLKISCKEVFNQIGFNKAPVFHDFDDEGNPVLKEWDSFESCLDWAVEMGVDEDFIGNGASVEDVPLSEAVINVYCLMNEITAPTWGSGGFLTPFARPSL